jgi:hypothetical protein
MNARWTLASAIALALASIALAQDRAGAAPPIDLARARSGDYAAYVVTLAVIGAEKDGSTRALATFEVARVTSEGVVVRDERVGRGPLARPSRERMFARGATIADLLELEPGQVLASDARDERATLAGRVLDARRLTFGIAVPNIGESHASLVLSPAVTVFGVVSFESALDIEARRGGTLTTTWELVGFGNGDEPAWGKTLAQARESFSPR